MGTSFGSSSEAKLFVAQSAVDKERVFFVYYYYYGASVSRSIERFHTQYPIEKKMKSDFDFLLDN